ncbi:MAG: glutamate synthase subunit beta [Eubacteriales bacterium]|nr:glutamate synthase subunit beta [Eubacteriales bacterium]
MGKLFGFLQYERQLPEDRDPLERLNDWNEIHELLPLEKQKEQAGRCMSCAVPFCHSGMVIKGVPTGCPLHNLIPEWNDLLYKEQWNLAKERLLRTNSFPEFTGRVCPALCEGACTCGIHQPQITVRQNELSIIEHAFENGFMEPRRPAVSTGKKIAIVGSGPAGLACAEILNRLGHSVTVFERSDRVGGLLMYGIPNMKLEKRIVDRRVELMKKEGVTFRTSCHVGVNQSADELIKDFDAVVLCCGSGKPRSLNVPGSEGRGVAYALSYLTASTRHVLDGKADLPEELNAKDKHVIIVGGGDTGTDCVGTALRQGCKSVHQLEIMPKPPVSRTAQNPWPEYPKILKIDYAQQEAIAKYGSDPRQYQLQTREIQRDEKGNVCAVITDRIQWIRGEDGRMSPKVLEGTTKKWQADLVLIAMGFTGPEDTLIQSYGLTQDGRSNVAAENYQTVCKGVFTAGDMHSGQSLVVRAINEGQQAAMACHEYLVQE